MLLVVQQIPQMFMQVRQQQLLQAAFGANIIDILDYANTNKYKTTRTLSGGDNNGSGFVQFMSGNWRNTNAVTSIDIFQVDGDTIAEYSQFALYGIKGS
jgi:hypothetical protein